MRTFTKFALAIMTLVMASSVSLAQETHLYIDLHNFSDVEVVVVVEEELTGYFIIHEFHRPSEFLCEQEFLMDITTGGWLCEELTSVVKMKIRAIQ